MPLIPKVEPKQEKKIVSARLDGETHAMLLRYATFLGNATHDYIITESLKRLFRRDRDFKEWLEAADSISPTEQPPATIEKGTTASPAKAKVA